MRRWFVLLVVCAVAVFAAAVVSPAGASVAKQSASAKTCPPNRSFVLATFPWGQRCIKAGQYCKKTRNPEYHKYSFQCVNGKLRKQTGKKKGK